MIITFTLWEDQNWQLSFISNMVFQPAEKAKLKLYVQSEDILYSTRLINTHFVTFWQLHGDLSSRISRTTHEDRTAPLTSG